VRHLDKKVFKEMSSEDVMAPTQTSPISMSTQIRGDLSFHLSILMTDKENFKNENLKKIVFSS
jgi:hypothetical protein